MRSKLLPVSALLMLVIFFALLRRAYRVSQVLLNPDELPVIASMGANPKVKFGQVDDSDRKSYEFQSRSASGEERAKIDIGKTVGDFRLAGAGEINDSIIDGIINDAMGNSIPLDDPSPEDDFERAGTSVETENGYRVQLIALRSSQQAANYVDRTKKLLGDMLKDLDIFIDELNLGEKGIFYRVQIGGFNSIETAADFCKGFLERNADSPVNCILAR